MGATEFGIYTFAFAWATLLAIPAGIGLPVANVRFIGEYLAAENFAKLRGLIARSRAITLGLGVAIAAVAVAAVLGLRSYIDPQYVVPLCLAMIAVPWVAGLFLESAIAKGFGWVDLAYAPIRLIQPLVLLGGVALILGLGGDATGNWVTGTAAASYVMIVLALQLAIRRRAARLRWIPARG